MMFLGVSRGDQRPARGSCHASNVPRYSNIHKPQKTIVEYCKYTVCRNLPIISLKNIFLLFSEPKVGAVQRYPDLVPRPVTPIQGNNVAR
jgi:hypothetical protein